VDVFENKLVELKISTRYVALSYVWGKCAQPNMLINDTIDVPHLPRTIKDAIHLTKLLGERYIWIDSICIDQDNIEDKHTLIGCMNRIYESACLTIVAAGGEDANAGLPGLSPASRVPERETNILPKSGTIRIVLSRPGLVTLVEKTRWNTRGWTYQEHVLSECCLFFTEREVFYSCPFHGKPEEGWQGEVDKFSGAHLSEWREAYALETGGEATNYETIIEWDNVWSRSVDPMVRPGRIAANENSDVRLVQYTEGIHMYTRRELSYQSDIILAFSGIINKIWPGEGPAAILKHGLPVESLPLAFLWEAINLGQLSRRAIDSAANPYIFPSWSWAGWIGPVSYPLTFDKNLKEGWLYKPGT
jgi:hypothetical protein